MHFTDDMAAENSFPPQGGWGGSSTSFHILSFCYNQIALFKGFPKCPRFLKPEKWFKIMARQVMMADPNIPL